MAINIKPSHEGLLHKNLGVATSKPIPAGKLEKATHSKNPKIKKRAVFAENAKHWNHGGKSAKQPHPKTNPGFYDTEPHAPRKKLALGKLTEQTSSLGNEVPKMVPQSPGRISGLGGPAHSFPKAPHASHGYGHPAPARIGHLRLSGHTGAHRIGKRP